MVVDDSTEHRSSAPSSTGPRPGPGAEPVGPPADRPAGAPGGTRDDAPVGPLGELLHEAVEAELETGRREESVEQAQRHLLVRVARVVGGTVIVLIGVVLLAAPGPGLLVIALGLGLLAQDVPFARRLLDRVRRRLPQDDDGKLPTSMVVMMVAVGVLATAGSLTFAFLR